VGHTRQSITTFSTEESQQSVYTLSPLFRRQIPTQMCVHYVAASSSPVNRQGAGSAASSAVAAAAESLDSPDTGRLLLLLPNPLLLLLPPALLLLLLPPALLLPLPACDSTRCCPADVRLLPAALLGRPLLLLVLTVLLPKLEDAAAAAAAAAEFGTLGEPAAALLLLLPTSAAPPTLPGSAALPDAPAADAHPDSAAAADSVAASNVCCPGGLSVICSWAGCAASSALVLLSCSSSCACSLAISSRCMISSLTRFGSACTAC
jgi:hypothetical protein